MDKQIYFRGISDDVRLSSRQVVSIAEGADGHLWFGTVNGLNRFDGEQVEIFSEEQGLTHSAIWSLFVDSSGRVWAGTETGLVVLEPGEPTFSEVPVVERGSVRVYSLYQDNHDMLWIGTSLGLFYLEGSVVSQFPIEIDVGGVRAITQSENGVLWLGTERAGVVAIEDSKVSRLPLSDEHGELESAYVRSIVAVDGKLWVGTYNSGLYRYEIVSGNLQRFGADDIGTSRVRSLLVEDDRTILIGSDNGFHVWNEDRSTFSSYFATRRNDGGLQGNIIFDLHKDRGGAVWVATYTGLSRFNLNVPELGYRSLHPLESDDVVVSFSEAPSGNVAIATLSGIALWDVKENTIIDLFDARPIADQITTIEHDAVGDLWVGTLSKGIWVLREGEPIAQHMHNPENEYSLPGNAITDLMLDRSENMWVSTHRHGLARYNPAKEQYERYLQNHISNLRHVFWHQLYEESGKIWVATSIGAFQLDPITSESTYISVKGVQGAWEAWTNILPMGDRVMLGGLGTGVAIVGIDGVVQASYPNLSSNSSSGRVRLVFSITEGGNDDVWISTPQAVYRYSKEREQFNRYDERHGLRNTEHNLNASIRLSSGHILLGGDNGITVVHPNMPNANTYQPPVVLRSLRVNHATQDMLDIEGNKILELGYRDSSLEISFAALDFTMPSRNQYKYQLEGFDDDWIDNGTSNVVNYTNLDPGTYTLRVMGSNSDGVWSDQVLTIPIKINPPLWATWWAYLLYLVAIAFVFYRLLLFNSQRVGEVAEDRFNRRLQLYVYSLDGTVECVMNASNDGTVRYCNTAVREVLGKDTADVIGHSIFESLIQDPQAAEEARKHLETEEHYQQTHEYLTPANKTSFIEVSISQAQFMEEDDISYAAIVRDVTKRKEEERAFQERFAELEQSEQNLRKEAQEREQEAARREEEIQKKLDNVVSQLRKAHDHVSDSLQVLMSLLNIQSGRSSDPEVVQLIQDHRLRLNVLTLLHEHLFAFSTNETVNMSTFLSSLVVSLHRQLAPKGLEIGLEKDLDDVVLPIELAVPCGLIANELISNALIHGYKDKHFGSGTVTIKFHKLSNEYVLFVSDDGKGLPLAFNLEKSGAVGMEVVSILVGQLDGAIKFVGGRGTSFEIRFPSAD